MQSIAWKVNLISNRILIVSMEKMNWVKEELASLESGGRLVPIRALEGSQGAHVRINGKEYLNMCSNNYLGLANHPEIRKAAIASIEKYGVGAGAVRSIAGTLSLHEELEKRVASFKHMEASVVFQGGLLANIAAIPILAGKEDLIFSEELNHASIIDGTRLSGARRIVYKHLDMQDLRKQLSEHRKEGKRALIVSDGVFSMDGDIAPLKEIVELGEEFDAMSYVDDAHGEGVLGDHGRGIVDHFHLAGRVDVEMGTFSKAIGAMGGFVAGSSNLMTLMRQRARPFLFSSALDPPEVGAVMKALEIIERDDSLLKKLWHNSSLLKTELSKLGFNTGNSKTPITPVIIGKESDTLQVSRLLYEEYSVFASPIVYPTVAQGTSRIRLMPSALHSESDIMRTVDAFAKVGKALNLVS